jgi:hypothetical protein
VINDHWTKLPEVVRHAMRQELGGTSDSLAKIILGGFAEQQAFMERKLGSLEEQLVGLAAQLEAMRLLIQERRAA